TEMLKIAREVGAPATCFITENSGKIIRTRFFSPLTEYPMCGHAAIALGAWLRDSQLLTFDESRIASIRLNTPHAFADIKVQQIGDEDLEVFLTLPPAQFTSASVSDDEISSVLDINPRRLDSDLERAVTVTDFRTLLVPMKHLSDLESIVPDANKIRAFCSRNELDTIFVFAPSRGDWSNGIRCREFCPAIGSLESAASGTTNRSVSCFLYQRGRLASTNEGSVTLSISQGVELARPSHIASVASISAGNVSRVDIGGRAVKVVNGSFLSPF
ncbi:MAG: PhzF family phenazine biosynthesis protein, partial [Arenicellales bacterium]